VNGEIQYKQ